MWKLIESLKETKLQIGDKVLIYNLSHKDRLPTQNELELNGNVFEVTEVFIDRYKIVSIDNGQRGIVKLVKYIEIEDVINKKCWIYE
jgi:hypothetical protein